MTEGNSEPNANGSQTTTFTDGTTLEGFRKQLEEFVAERDWNKFHTPRNLALALVGEVGELAECFQWKGEVQQGLPDWSQGEKLHLSEEMSDVFIYLIRLADKCGIDLTQAVQRKMLMNARKYPADKAKGSMKKYTAYVTPEELQEIEKQSLPLT